MKVLKRKTDVLPSEAYLARVVQNAAYDAMRSRMREPERYYELDGADHAMDSVCERVDESGFFNLSATYVPPRDEYDLDLWDQFQVALRQLSGPLVKVLMLVAAGHSYEEISAMTETNIGTVRSRLHHARKRARQLLGNLAYR